MPDNELYKQDFRDMLVATGTHVEIEMANDSGEIDRFEFDIVPDEIADFAHGFLGEGTPLAKAILGHPAGSDVYFIADGTQKVHILSVGPAKFTPPMEVAARRKATYQKAIEDSDRTNAIIFASSFTGKWGDYDPEGVAKWQDEQKKQLDEG